VGPAIWILDDGRAGHRSQAGAVAKRLGGTAVVVPCAVPAPWRWLAPRLPPRRPAAVLRGLDAAGPPRIAIGAGRRAALANRVLKYRFGAEVKTVQLLDPRIDPRHFDLLAVPAHDRAAGGNVIRFEGSLHAVDASWLAAARAAWPTLARQARPRTVVIVGGLSPRRGRGPLKAAFALLARDSGSLLLVTSPRTPAATTAYLRRAATAGALLHVHGEGANPYAGCLGWGDRFLLDGDSVNMLSEALATGRQVLVPDWRVGGGAGRFLARCRRYGWVVDPRHQALPAPVRPFPAAETARIGRELCRRFSPDH